MKNFLLQFERNCVSGTIVLLPLVVFFIILERVWGFFHKYGEKFAHFLHLGKVFGTTASDILGGFILLVLLYCSGYLMRLSLLRRFSNWLDDKLIVFLPGYEKNKKEAEEKLNKKIKKPDLNTNLPILLKHDAYWQPAYLIEESKEGNAVVFVPIAPFKDQGQIYLVGADHIKRLPNTNLENLDASIKSLGKGILNFK